MAIRKPYCDEVRLPFLVLGEPRAVSIEESTTTAGIVYDTEDIYGPKLLRGEPVTVHHDISSLGICPLEIALWKPLILYDDGV